ncbi:MAG TPA: sulfatase-like hydrolase/transferase [Kofleriaceae bacterium]
MMRNVCVAAALAAALTACGKKESSDKGGVANGVPGESSGGKDKEIAQAPARGPEHPVYSLVDNRLSGHVQREAGLLVLPGSAGFGKYLRFGGKSPPWKLRAESDGIKVAAIKSKSAGIVVPLTAAQASGSIRIRARSAGAQRLGVRVNGKKDKEVTAELADGWSTAELAVPAGALEAGENEIIFFAGKAGLEFAWIQVGGAPARDETPAIYDAGKKSLAMAERQGMAWYVTVPDKGLVTADLDQPGCTVEVQAVPQGGQAVVGKLTGRGSAVDLSKLAGKPARLELVAGGCPSVNLANAALVVPGAAPEVKRGPAPKYVVLWVMDSLRADRVRTIVGESARPEVPVMDELASTSAVFTQAYVQGNETKCSHASIWTSLYPVNHKMIPPNSKIDPKWVTVEEVAKSGGMMASGVSANGYITPDRGFGEKWDKFRNHIHEGGGLTAGDVLTKGIDSITEPTKPWFLYLGSIDTHVSWRVKEPWFSKYDPEPYTGRFKVEASGVDMGKVAAGSLKITDRDRKRIIAIYDSNVSYQDSQVGVLLAKLKEWGIADQTMVILTADHGDEQFEDGRVGHGGSILETLVHVPMIIHYPPMIPAGKVSEGVEVVDIVPTVADALGVKADENWQGESLLPLVNGVGRGYPRMSMASKYENAHAGRMGIWKAYYAGGKGQLYDVTAQPQEKQDVQKEHPTEMRMVSDPLWLLRTYNPEWKKSRWGNPANVTAAFAADMGE